MPQFRNGPVFRANTRRRDQRDNSVEQNTTASMAWRPRAHPCAAAFAIFIAITGFTAPLVLDTGWLRGAADSTTPATPQTIRRRATVAVAKRQSIARGAGGFAARRARPTARSMRYVSGSGKWSARGRPKEGLSCCSGRPGMRASLFKAFLISWAGTASSGSLLSRLWS